MITLNIFATSLAAAGLLMLVLIRLAPWLRLLDHPGGRKEHGHTTPIIGGLGIALVLLAAITFLQPHYSLGLTAALVVILVIGLADDVREIPPLPKFLAQSAACLLMVYIAEVQIHQVGDLLGFGPIGLSVFVVPMTAFAVIGVINALNMADGIDGHAGGIGVITFITYAYVARESGLWDQYKLLVVLTAATGGYLLLNARWPWNKRARTFLGDTGSMLLGFLIGWFAIDLTTGNGAPSDGTRTFPAICALWVIVIPLSDCVSLMIRRKLAGRSMFVADRQHFHHYLLNRGFSVGQASFVSGLINVGCALIAVIGWQMGLPEPLMFGGFVVLFVAYHVHMQKAFRSMPQHSVLGVTTM